MDLHFTDAIADEGERAAIDGILGPPDSGWGGGKRDAQSSRQSVGGQAARGRRHLLLPALHAVQAHAGWISPGALNYLCARLTVPPAEAYGVASFYALFSTTPQPPTVVHLCDDIACKTRGADALCARLEAEFGPAGSSRTDAPTTWKRSPCLGLCDKAPAAFVQRAGPGREDFSAAPVSAEQVLATLRAPVELDLETSASDAAAERDRRPAEMDVVDEAHRPDQPARQPGISAARPAAPNASSTRSPSHPLTLSLHHCGAEPASLDEYRARGGYQALRAALEMGAPAIIRELADAKLTGRGGAAFPTSVKWKAVAEAPARPHYVVCNADESEPGTFKDRVLMERDPFAVIESFTIAGIACGAEQGYLYIRGEYPEATRQLDQAIAQARMRGLLGSDIMGRGVEFDIEIRRGGGAYICGEETALLESIEGKRGEPRNKPPFPAQEGLFGKPTAVNNVETLVNVLPILARGGPEYAATGTAQSTGTRLFCVSGCVEQPGVYEVPYGLSLRELLRLAGGVTASNALQAVLLGGAAGAFVRPDELDIPLTLEGARAAGATLGSGVVMVFDDTVDIQAVVVRIAAFFRDESCGQCVPCRVGTVRQEEALRRLVAGSAHPEQEIALLGELDQVMRDASICGLGQTASTAILSAIHRLGLFQGGAR
ncbi:MAG TPA: NAD(P)H-dependent oxidoreductase subunit E [Chthonomonadaceae bacterium]|nr:NAD(P)H-dependent oxidoreductase subunit E [Chthonomonadaceae bacterium]